MVSLGLHFLLEDPCVQVKMLNQVCMFFPHFLMSHVNLIIRPSHGTLRGQKEVFPPLQHIHHSPSFFLSTGTLFCLLLPSSKPMVLN